MKLNDHVSETLLNIKMDKVTSKVSENKLVKGSLSLTGESKLFVKLKIRFWKSGIWPEQLYYGQIKSVCTSYIKEKISQAILK